MMGFTFAPDLMGVCLGTKVFIPISSSMRLFGLRGPQPQIGGGLNVRFGCDYHSWYFYIVCCECGDYRH
jgi:hypothetical protein